MCERRISRSGADETDHYVPTSEVTIVRIDLDFDVLTVEGQAFPARRLLGRPTILVLLRYLG
jgi:hypothetical protein